MMKRNAKAAAEVTIMVRLRLVRRYRGMNCVKKSIVNVDFNDKSTNFLLEIRTFVYIFDFGAAYE